MIFASDLDQTLIYSENFLSNNYTDPKRIKKESLSIIEYYQGAPLCYIHKELIPKLQDLDLLGCFVPVTTRTEEQFNRIDFGKYNIHPEYAVTTNGAKVLQNGILDEQWREETGKRLAALPLTAIDIQELIQTNISAKAIKKVRVAEDVFTYCVLHPEMVDLDEIESLRTHSLLHEWEISLQGTKLYFMPASISKWDAIEYIASKTDNPKVIGAGDSLLDLPLLKKSTHGLVPGHGEIFNQKLHLQYNLRYCGKYGIEASLAILDFVLAYAKTK